MSVGGEHKRQLWPFSSSFLENIGDFWGVYVRFKKGHEKNGSKLNESVDISRYLVRFLFFGGK